MGYFSIWPMFAGLFALVLLAATPFLKAADTPPSATASRVQTLDGLRGFLALAVFFHHGAIYHTYIQDGIWRPPSDRLLRPPGAVWRIDFLYDHWLSILVATAGQTGAARLDQALRRPALSDRSTLPRGSGRHGPRRVRY